ncbi:MAG: hypothetical protein JJU11_04890 [Candidatus Sumerlaeia bacterium]|nr:hypothetical protein [Candidatus Sumerlaeia bacterium]
MIWEIKADDKSGDLDVCRIESTSGRRSGKRENAGYVAPATTWIDGPGRQGTMEKSDGPVELPTLAKPIMLQVQPDREDLRVRKRHYLLPFLLILVLLAPFHIRVEERSDFGLQHFDRLRNPGGLYARPVTPQGKVREIVEELDFTREQVATAQFIIEGYREELEASRGWDPGRLATVNIGDYRFLLQTGLLLDLLLAGAVAGLLWSRKRRKLAESFIEAENARFHRLSAELEEQVRESARIIEKFNRLQDKLVAAEKLASIGRMSATLAHEIRNPLSIIKSSTEIIGEDLGDGSGSQSALDLVRDEVTRMDRIVSDLLNFARPKAPKLDNHRVVELLRPWIPPIVEELEKDDIQLVPQFEHESGEVRVDPDQLYQVFLNLMWNARDALRGTANPHVFVRLEDGGVDFVRMIIQDTGIGMIPDVLGQIKEPFFTTKTRGTGLGIPVSIQLIEGMGGRFEIESRLDYGTTVTLYLPRVGRPAVVSQSDSNIIFPIKKAEAAQRRLKAGSTR